MSLEISNAPRKLLVIERKLISNRGHHHTQIAALKSFFPEHSFFLVAGEGYDGFLGSCILKLTSRTAKLSRARAKRDYGALHQRLAGFFGILKAGSLSLPHSPYAAELSNLCRQLEMNSKDIVVVPTAELDLLEAAVDVSRELGANAPKIVLRFLGVELGERHIKIRHKRLNSLASHIPSNVFLFTETKELASYFRQNFGFKIQGGFYMPCSISFGDFSFLPPTQKKRLRIGVFGSPRSEKGSLRLPDIVTQTAKINSRKESTQIEFLIQGSDTHFIGDGVYSSMREYFSGKNNVWVTAIGDRLSPQEFTDFFKSADVLLLPYDTSIYGLQGSGIIQDAVLAFKPLIYSEGMSMAEFLTHGNAVAATTNSDFAEAILSVANDSSAFIEGTLKAASYYKRIVEEAGGVSCLIRGR